MGIYLQTPYPTSKAEQLQELYKAKVISKPVYHRIPEDKALICVVENGFFDAAAYIYSESEYKAFRPTLSDQRPRTWLTMDKKLVEELTNGL